MLKAKLETKLKVYLVCSNKWFLDIEQCLSTQAINPSSPLYFSIMKNEKLLRKFEISSLLKINVPLIDTCQYTYNLPISKPFNTPSNNGKGIKKSLLAMEDEYIRILTNQIIGSSGNNIQESEYLLKEGVLSTHAPIYIMECLLNRQPKVLKPVFEYGLLRWSTHFISGLNKNLIDDYLKYPYCQFQKNLMYKIYTAELWKLCYYSIKLVEAYPTDFICWDDLRVLVKQIVKASKIANYMFSLTMTENKLTFIFPKFILSKSLDISGDEKRLIQMSDGT